jgi:hypothetical protein
MTVLSPRYATATLVLLALALVPTVVTSYVRGTVVEQPPLRDLLPDVLDGRMSAPTNRRASTIKREFDSDDWGEREYAGIGEPAIKVLVVRSYDMKRLYHHPELAVSEANYAAAQLVSVPSAAGALDVHVLEGEEGRHRMAAYALLYRGRTVARPLLFQLTVAPELLLLGRRPLTLVFAEQRTVGPETAQDLAASRVVQTVAAMVLTLNSRSK